MADSDMHAVEAELHEQQVRYAIAVGELEGVEGIARRARPDEAVALRTALDDKRARVRALRDGIADAMRRLAIARRDLPVQR